MQLWRYINALSRNITLHRLSSVCQCDTILYVLSVAWDGLSWYVLRFWIQVTSISLLFHNICFFFHHRLSINWVKFPLPGTSDPSDAVTLLIRSLVTICRVCISVNQSRAYFENPGYSTEQRNGPTIIPALCEVFHLCTLSRLIMH